MWGTAGCCLVMLHFLAVNVCDGYHGDFNHLSYPTPSHLSEIFSWSQIDFAFPSHRARQDALWTGLYDPTAIAPIGITAAGHRIFISMPRWKSGVPAALATFSFPSNTTAPLLQPYPNWSWHRPGDCQGITSVFRVKLDECGRLWVVDTGAVNTFVKFEQLCPPQVHVFDVNTDQLIYRYRFPQDVLREESLLTNIEVEYPDSHCGGHRGAAGAVIYVSDTTNFALIVADLRLRGADSAWRVTDKTMYPSPEAGTFIVGQETFELMDGVLSLALSPRSTKADRTLFYHAMSSFRQRWVRTSVLRNVTNSVEDPRAYRSALLPRPSQVAAASMDQHGVMFFGLLTDNALACWNTYKQFTPNNIAVLAQDDQALQFVTTTTVDNEGRVWALSTRFQRYILETMDFNEINFRVLMAPSSDALVRGTSCELNDIPARSHQVHVHHHHNVDNSLLYQP